VHGCVVSSSVPELFGTFSFKRKSTEQKVSVGKEATRPTHVLSTPNRLKQVISQPLRK